MGSAKKCAPDAAGRKLTASVMLRSCRACGELRRAAGTTECWIPGSHPDSSGVRQATFPASPASGNASTFETMWSQSDWTYSTFSSADNPSNPDGGIGTGLPMTHLENEYTSSAPAPTRSGNAASSRENTTSVDQAGRSAHRPRPCSAMDSVWQSVHRPRPCSAMDSFTVRVPVRRWIPFGGLVGRTYSVVDGSRMAAGHHPKAWVQGEG